MDSNTVLTAIGTTLVTNFVTDKDNGPLKSLNDVWEITIGGFLHSIAEKKRAKYTASVEAYKREIEKKVMSISPEDIDDEPPLNIIGPVLEASKYHIEEEDIRLMFANLVAASMNKRYSRSLHPAYVEIIKQLDPLDAQLLSSFSLTSMEKRSLPIANVGFIDSGEYHIRFRDVYIKNGVSNNQLKHSIQNLKRLGLIETHYQDLPTYKESGLGYNQLFGHWGTGDEQWNFFNKVYDYDSFKKSLEYKFVRGLIRDDFPNRTDLQVHIQKGVIGLTELGFSFVEVSVSDE